MWVSLDSLLGFARFCQLYGDASLAGTYNFFLELSCAPQLSLGVFSGFSA